MSTHNAQNRGDGLPLCSAADAGLPWVEGESACVFAFGKWYRGVVVKAARKRVTVRYTTSSGTTRDKAVGPDKVARLDEVLPCGQEAHRVAHDFRHLAGKVGWCEQAGRYVPNAGHNCCGLVDGKPQA